MPLVYSVLRFEFDDFLLKSAQYEYYQIIQAFDNIGVSYALHSSGLAADAILQNLNKGNFNFEVLQRIYLSPQIRQHLSFFQTYV
jgi:hypothetical protein